MALSFILEYLGVVHSEDLDPLLQEYEAEQLENIRLKS
jgi:hypothetical protein